MLSGFWPLREWGVGLSESAKKRNFDKNLFSGAVILNQVLRSCEK